MDFVIVPSGTEGFGMPVLESMAMGTPVIHQLISPFDEFTSWQWNLLIKSNEVEEYYDKTHGHKWKIHKFDIGDMINAIMIASELKDRDERSKNLRELAKKYDIENLYVRFLRMIYICHTAYFYTVKKCGDKLPGSFKAQFAFYTSARY
jgi:Glycosyl transferases group 1.